MTELTIKKDNDSLSIGRRGGVQIPRYCSLQCGGKEDTLRTGSDFGCVYFFQKPMDYTKLKKS